MTPTIILADYVGRLGNRLYLFIHVLAMAMEHGFHVCNLTLQPHASWFENLSRNSWCRYPAPAHGYPLHRWARGFRAAVEWLANRQRKGRGNGFAGFYTIALDLQENFAMDSPAFLQICRKYHCVILFGWFFRADSLLERHQDEIRRFLRLRKGMDQALECELEKGRQENDWQIALHIRQGDFKTWQGGKCYLPPEVFARHAWRIKTAHSNKKIQFWVCSDEPVDLSAFPPGTQNSPGQTLREDLRIMTSCEFILGGSSTLARAAAFLGAARLHNLSLDFECPTDPRFWMPGASALIDATIS